MSSSFSSSPELSPEQLSIPQIRKYLHDIRDSWSKHSTESLFLPSQHLPNGMSYESFALKQVLQSNQKRHSRISK